LSLSQVIYALSLPPNKRPAHINYRDSKLTRILQPQLEGNALICVLACVSPTSLEETRSTLRFASRAKLVQTHARVNREVDDAARIELLQRQLTATTKALEEMEQQNAQVRQESLQATAELERLKKQVSLLSLPRAPYDSLCETVTVETEDGGTTSDGQIPIDSHAVDLLTPPDSEPEERFEVVGSPKDPGEETRLAQANLLTPAREGDGERSKFERVTPRREKPPIEQQSLPSEVLVLSADGRRNKRQQDFDEMDDGDQTVDFLHKKLEETEDLVDSLMSDLVSAKQCVHHLIFRNVKLGTKIEKLSNKFAKAQESLQEVVDSTQKYRLLKFSIYLAILFVFSGNHEFFLVTVMFLWLTLEQLT